jgi:hypothetical protein
MSSGRATVFTLILIGVIFPCFTKSFEDNPAILHDFLSRLEASRVPFYVYEDSEITMDGFHGVICENQQNVDTVLAKAFRGSQWRTFDPLEAELFVVTIPFHQSFFCGEKVNRERELFYKKIENNFEQFWKSFDDHWNRAWKGRNHLERLERAVLKVKEHMSGPLQKDKPHILLSFSWQVSRWNYMTHDTDTSNNVREAERMFPMRFWQLLENVTTLRYEVYGQSPWMDSYAERPREPFTLYSVPWENTRFSLIVPFTTAPGIQFLADPPSYEAWKHSRDLTFWYHTTNHPSAHGGNDLRRFPLKHNETYFVGGSVGFTIPEKEWISGWGRSRFCFIVRGDTPSTHSFAHAIASNCIPIVISDHFDEVALPFGNGRGPPDWLSLEDFAFVFTESVAIAEPGAILAAVSDEASVREKLRALTAIRPLLLYSHPQSKVAEAVAMTVAGSAESKCEAQVPGI